MRLSRTAPDTTSLKDSQPVLRRHTEVTVEREIISVFHGPAPLAEIGLSGTLHCPHCGQPIATLDAVCGRRLESEGQTGEGPGSEGRGAEADRRSGGPKGLLLLLLAACLALAGASAAAQAPAITFQVNSTADAVDQNPGDGKCATGSFINGSTTPQCTLRAAVDEANALSAANPSSSYAISLPSGTYSLTALEACFIDNTTFAGIPLCLTGNIAIKGPSSGSAAVIDAGGTDHAMRIPPGGVVQLANLTIQNGFDNSLGTGNIAGGGGVHSEGKLTVSHCLFTENRSANDLGSAIYNGGTSLTVEGSTFQGNSGAVLASFNGAATSIGQSYFTGNTAQNGVALTSQNAGNVTISNSTFTQNNSSSDYVIFQDGGSPTLTMTNSTVSFNTVATAYVVYSGGTAVLNNDTIYGNTTSSGQSVFGGTSLTISNSIVYDTGDSSVCNTFTDLGHNFIGSETFCFGTPAPSPTTQIGVDPKMGSIILDGGSVPIELPLPGSPAIGGGSTATPGGNSSGACTALDENGKPRGVGTTCTVGAAEPLAGLQVNDIVPAQGGSGGNVTMQITGFGLDPSSTVALHLSGQTDIAPKIFSVSPDATAITAGFSLVGAALGTYDVVVTTSASSVTLPGGFTVAKATPSVLQSFLTGPNRLRAGRQATFVLTYTNRGNNDAYLVPLYLTVPNGFTGTIQGVQAPPGNSQQVLTDYSSDSLAVLSGPPATSPVQLALLLPVIPAGSENTLTFTVLAVGSEGMPFIFAQQLGTPYSSNPDTGVADPNAVNAEVSDAVLNDTANLGVTPSASAQSAMGTYASSQLTAVVQAGEISLLQSFGSAPGVYSIPQLLDDVGAYGAAYKSPMSGAVDRHPLYIPGLSNGPPGPGACTGTPLAPGGSCLGSYNKFPDGGPIDQCSGCAGGGAESGGDLVGSVDPNLKTGPLGVGDAHYTQANTPFPYLIEFENEATASAPAQTVTVTDMIDTSKLDLSTFQFGPISFGAAPFVLNPPAGVTSFQGSIDLRPAQDIIVDVTATLNKANGVITWNFLSLDPATMQLTTDPTAGFLPPDVTPPAGIGHVAFTLTPLASVADTAQICNTGVVVFDTNAPISTAQYCNTKDISAPSSMVQALAATQTTTAFMVNWSGSDTGSGVGTYTIYSNLDGGAFTPWLTATAATSGTFTGVAGHTYGFYSIATDLAGNVEPAKTQAEATTFIGVAAGSFSPGSVVFPATAMGATSTMAVTLTSNGAMPLNVTGLTQSDTADFSEVDTCISASPLAVGQTCTVTLSFSPTSGTSLAGPVAATLSVSSNAPTAPLPVTITATVDLPQAVWLANADGTLDRFANSGVAANPAAALSGGGAGIAIDHAGNVWSAAAGGSSVAEFSSAGSVVGTYSGAGISSPVAVALSGAGYVWVANANNTLSILQPNGTAVTGVSGISDASLSKPSGIAIDGSGSVWVTNAGDSSLTQFLGAADPVVTPLVNAVANSTLAMKP